MCYPFLTQVGTPGLSQHVKVATRSHGTTENILDLVFTINPDIVQKISTKEGIADHDSVIVDLKISPTRKRPAKRKIFLRNKADIEGIKQAFQEFADKYLCDSQNKDVNAKWEEIQSSIFHTMERYVPHKYSTSRFNLPWFNRPLRRTVKKKQRLYNKDVKSGKAADWEEFKVLTHILIKESRSTYMWDTH